METTVHNLVPQLILDRYAQGMLGGRFEAVCLFVDVTGFSPITEALMAHGQHGAEVLATLMRAVFDPLMQSVHEQGGFVASMAGDAFTAVFAPEAARGPVAGDLARNTALQRIPERALAAAWKMQEHMRTRTRQATPYGVFSLSTKVGLDAGEVGWGIVLAEDDSRAAYYFQGPAVDGSAQAENLAEAGDIILSPRMNDQVQELVMTEPVADHHRLKGIHTPAPSPRPVDLVPIDPQILARFFPETLVARRCTGEFRQVVSLFISLPTVRTEVQLGVFMRTLFALQDRYGGLLKGLNFGDKGSNVLLFWGAPLAYENDIERTLSFILDLQVQTSIPIKAGITYRIAHAGCVGSPLYEEFTCYGRGVNLAARFMTAAPRGEIWLDEGVARRAQGQFKIDYEGELAFKGFAEKQEVYVLYERKENIEALFPGELVGREAELAQLAAFAAPLWEGQCAGAMVVHGEPGVGKSRLVYEFQLSVIGSAGQRARLPLQSREVLWAQCQTDEILRGSLNPFRYWLRRYFAVSEGQAEARNKRSFNRKVDYLISSTADPKLAEELDRTRTFLGAQLDLRWPDSLYEQVNPQGRYENTLMGLVALLQAESLQRPVIIHLEDIQWLDADSKAFLPRLARAATIEEGQSYPIAIIATARPEATEPLLGEGLAHQEIDLRGLSPEGLEWLVESHLDRPAAPRLLELLAERSEGNPFFAEQILHYLQEEGLLQRSAGDWTVREALDVPLPTDVRAVLVARLDRLDPDVKEAVQTASVLGREFEVQLLARMLPGDTGLSHKVAEAETAAIWWAVTEVRYLFKHGLLRDAAYRMQVRARRQDLHKRAAKALESLYAGDLAPHYGELGYHAEQAGESGLATDWYLRAAERAKDQGVMVEARGYYDRAMQTIPVKDVERQWRALAGRAEVLGVLGEAEARQADAVALLELAEELADESLLAEAYSVKAAHAYTLGDYREALAAFEPGLAAARRSGNLRVEAYMLGLKVSALARLGEMDAASATATEALIKAEDLGDERVLVRNLNNVAEYYVASGDHGRAADLLSRHVSISRRMGDRFGEALGLLNLAYNYLLLGMYDAARDAAEQSMRLTDSVGARRLSAYNRLHLCLAHLRLGSPATSRKLVEAAEPILREVEDTFGEAVCRSYRGLALEAEGQTRKAASAFRKASQMLSKTGAAGHAADALAGLCRCALAQGQVDWAAARGHEIWEYLTEHGAGGLEFPILAYETCAQILESSGDHEGSLAAVEAGYNELMTRAEQISDLEWRRSFLEMVPEHRAIVEMRERVSAQEHIR